VVQLEGGEISHRAMINTICDQVMGLNFARQSPGNHPCWQE
jgi:hypothetical protein